VTWGSRACFASLRFLIDLIQSGRLRAETPALRRVVAKYGSRAGREFEDLLATLFEDAAWDVRRRVTRLAGLPIARDDGSTLGDIDVLAVDHRTHRIVAADAKALTPALTATEIALELGATLAPRPGMDAPAAVRILERAAWLRSHLAELRETLHLGDGNWEVEPLIVTSEELISPYVTTMPVRVVSYRRLARELR